MTLTARQLIEQVFREISGEGPYALVDYPNYANPGDAAIWVGARIALERVMGRPPSYVSTIRHFDARHCRKAVSGGPVFLLGGGNFGSLYEKHHRRRLRILEEIADETIVLLPLSIAEKAGGPDAAIVAETRRVLAGCGRLTVLSREQKSRDCLRETYGIETRLCPDTAHFHTPPVVVPVAETVALMRRDSETPETENTTGCPPDRIFDWRDGRSLTRVNRLGKLSPFVPWHRPQLRIYDLVARRKVDIACRLIGEGRSVVTDRLHGVILASMMERHVIALDNMTGKVSSYVDTWAAQLPGVTLRRPDE